MFLGMILQVTECISKILNLGFTTGGLLVTDIDLEVNDMLLALIFRLHPILMVTSRVSSSIKEFKEPSLEQSISEMRSIQIRILFGTSDSKKMDSKALNNWQIKLKPKPATLLPQI